jgi:hypothetical protein
MIRKGFGLSRSIKRLLQVNHASIFNNSDFNASKDYYKMLGVSKNAS